MARYAKTYEIAVGDKKPDVVHYILVSETGAAQDLTGADAVKFSLHNLDTGVTVEDENAASFVDLTAGKVKYAWGANETDTAGRYIGWFTVYWAADSADPMTPTAFPINIFNPYERISG